MSSRLRLSRRARTGRTRMIRSTGVVGLLTFVVLFAALIAMSPGAEPTFLAKTEEALAFHLDSTGGLVQAAMAVAGLAAIGWIWFVAGLCRPSGRAEGSPPWWSVVALVSGVILAALLLLNTGGERGLVRCRRPRSGSRQLRLRCQLSRVGQRLARSGLFRGVLRLGRVVHSGCRSLAWLVGDRQRGGARARAILLDFVALASAVCRLLDLVDHHVYPAHPKAERGAEGSRWAAVQGGERV